MHFASRVLWGTQLLIQAAPDKSTLDADADVQYTTAMQPCRMQAQLYMPLLVQSFLTMQTLQKTAEWSVLGLLYTHPQQTDA